MDRHDAKFLIECFNPRCAVPPVRNSRGSRAAFWPTKRCPNCGRFACIVAQEK